MQAIQKQTHKDKKHKITILFKIVMKVEKQQFFKKLIRILTYKIVLKVLVQKRVL